MKLLAAVVVLSALIAPVFASENAKSKAPGQIMQEKGSVKGTTGASGYAPGQKMQDKGSVKGTTGASGYAPGHADDKKDTRK